MSVGNLWFFLTKLWTGALYRFIFMMKWYTAHWDRKSIWGNWQISVNLMQKTGITQVLPKQFFWFTQQEVKVSVKKIFHINLLQKSACACVCVWGWGWGWSRGLKHMFGRIFLIRPLSFEVNATRHALTFLYTKFSVTQNCSYFCHFTCLFHGRQTFSYFNCFNVNSGSIIKRFRWIYLIKYCVFST